MTSRVAMWLALAKKSDRPARIGFGIEIPRRIQGIRTRRPGVRPSRIPATAPASSAAAMKLPR